MAFQLNALIPLLETYSLEETISFYTEVLGFAVTGYEENVWASLERDSVAIMFARPKTQEDGEEPRMSGSLYFYPDQIEEIWEKVRDKTEVCYPLEEFDYGVREFAIYDNNGYLLQFGQEIEEEEGPGD